MWPEANDHMCGFWSLLGGAGAVQIQPPLVPGLGPSQRYKGACDWLPFVLGLKAFARSYVGNKANCQLCQACIHLVPSQDWMQLMPDLGPPDECYSASREWLLLVSSLGMTELAAICLGLWAFVSFK